MKKTFFILFISLCMACSSYAELLLSAGLGFSPTLVKRHSSGVAYTLETSGPSFSLDALWTPGNAPLGLYGAFHMGVPDGLDYKTETSMSGETSNWYDVPESFDLNMKVGGGWMFLKGGPWRGFAGAGLSLNVSRLNYEIVLISQQLKQVLLGVNDTIRLYYFFTPRIGAMFAADYSLYFLPVKFTGTDGGVSSDWAGSFRTATNYNIRLGVSFKF